MEKHLVADPADVDGDCVDDITELGDPVGMNPVNSAATIAPNTGAVVIPDLETFEELAYEFEGDLHVKFVLFDMLTDRPGLYFQNSKTYVLHFAFLRELELQGVRGTMTYDPELTAPEGSSGGLSSRIKRIQFVLLLPSVLRRGPILISPPAYRCARRQSGLFTYRTQRFQYVQSELPLYKDSRIALVFDEDIHGETKFLELNPGGRVRPAAGHGTGRPSQPPRHRDL